MPRLEFIAPTFENVFRFFVILYGISDYYQPFCRWYFDRIWSNIIPKCKYFLPKANDHLSKLFEFCHKTFKEKLLELYLKSDKCFETSNKVESLIFRKILKIYISF